MKHPITTAHNKVEIYVDLIHSPAARVISQQPHLVTLVKEVLHQTNVTQDIMTIEQDMGRDIGYSQIVETSESDTILYAQQVHEKVYTRFIKNGKPDSTQLLSIVLRRDEDGDYELVNTWVGPQHPPVPGSDNETPASKPFWETHAFLFDGQPLQTRTVTKTCPY